MNLRAQRAFTLLEIMLTLGLGAILTTACVRILVQTIQTDRTIRQTTTADDARELPFKLLRADLDQLSIGAEIALDAEGLHFSTFQSFSIERFAARRPVDVTYRMGEAGHLIRSERVPGTEDATASNCEIVEARRVLFEISDGRRWKPAWNPRQDGQARAIRVTLESSVGEVTTRVFALQPPRWQEHNRG